MRRRGAAAAAWAAAGRAPALKATKARSGSRTSSSAGPPPRSSTRKTCSASTAGTRSTRSCRARRGRCSNQLAARNVDAIDMSFALAAKAFEEGVPVKVTGVATAVLGAIVARKDAGPHAGSRTSRAARWRRSSARRRSSTSAPSRSRATASTSRRTRRSSPPPRRRTWSPCSARRTWTPSSPGSRSPTRWCCAARASTWPSRSTSGARRPGGRPAFPCTSAISCTPEFLRKNPGDRARPQRRAEGRGGHLVQPARRADGDRRPRSRSCRRT